jgi:hypothetical protein
MRTVPVSPPAPSRCRAASCTACRPPHRAPAGAVVGVAELAAELGGVHRVPEREHRLALRLGLGDVHRLERDRSAPAHRRASPATAPGPGSWPAPEPRLASPAACPRLRRRARRRADSSRNLTRASSEHAQGLAGDPAARGITRSGIATLTRLRTGRPAAKSSTIQAASTPNCSAAAPAAAASRPGPGSSPRCS